MNTTKDLAAARETQRIIDAARATPYNPIPIGEACELPADAFDTFFSGFADTEILE